LPPPELKDFVPLLLGPDVWLGAELKVWELEDPPELCVEVPPELKLWLPLEKLWLELEPELWDE
jgi:hypothetical protein